MRERLVWPINSDLSKSIRITFRSFPGLLLLGQAGYGIKRGIWKPIGGFKKYVRNDRKQACNYKTIEMSEWPNRVSSINGHWWTGGLVDSR